MSRIVATLVLVAACLAASVVTALHRGRAPVEPAIGGEAVEPTVATIATPSVPAPWIAVVVPQNEVIVTAALSARLAAVEVHMGDAVVAGQPLAILDPAHVRHQSNEAQARLHAREAQRRQALAARAAARDKHSRAGRLVGLVPEAEVAEAAMAVAAAEADVDRAAAEARVERVEIDKSADALRDTTIRSPITGEVTQCMVDSGALVEEGDPIAHVVDRRRMVRFAVPIDERPPVVGAGIAVDCDHPVASHHAAVVAHVAPHVDGAARMVLVEATLLDADGIRIGAVCRAQPAS